MGQLPPSTLPQHVAIIMDGNGRWANRRQLPRVAGHRAGVENVRLIVERCAELGIRVLTVFAFSSENWRRPPTEVRLLLELFSGALEQEVEKLNQNGIRLLVIGDRAKFPGKLRRRIDKVEQLTADNEGLTLVIAANYGGRWDIAHSAYCQGSCFGRIVSSRNYRRIDRPIPVFTKFARA